MQISALLRHAITELLGPSPPCGGEPEKSNAKHCAGERPSRDGWAGLFGEAGLRSQKGTGGGVPSNSNPNLEAELLLSHTLNLTRTQLIAHGNKEVTPEQTQHFMALLARRKQGEPIAYLLGYREFWSLPIKVTPDTLIPRPETELLVELVLKKLAEKKSAHIAELGTGSGAIALAIAHERPQWTLVATDNSPAALEVAKQNFSTKTNITLRQGHWYQALNNESFDAIVSNPPYIAEDDPHLNQGDLRFEPLSALVSGPDGLRDLRLIIEQAPKFLNPNGWLILEHSYNQGEAVKHLMQAKGYKQVRVYQDLSGHDRATVGQLDIEDHEKEILKAIISAVQKADSGKTKFIKHEKIVEWLSNWGTEDELEPPRN